MFRYAGGIRKSSRRRARKAKKTFLLQLLSLLLNLLQISLMVCNIRDVLVIFTSNFQYRNNALVTV
jgi:hypothetical protein